MFIPVFWGTWFPRFQSSWELCWGGHVAAWFPTRSARASLSWVCSTCYHQPGFPASRPVSPLFLSVLFVFVGVHLEKYVATAVSVGFQVGGRIHVGLFGRCCYLPFLSCSQFCAPSLVNKLCHSSLPVRTCPSAQNDLCVLPSSSLLVINLSWIFPSKSNLSFLWTQSIFMSVFLMTHGLPPFDFLCVLSDKF